MLEPRKCGRSGQTDRNPCASLGWRKHAEVVLVEMVNLVPHESDRRQESLVGRTGWGRRSSKSVDKYHGPAMLCVQKPKTNDPRILSRD